MENVLDIFRKWDTDERGVIGRDTLNDVLISLGLPDAPILTENAGAGTDAYVDYASLLPWVFSDGQDNCKSDTRTPTLPGTSRRVQRLLAELYALPEQERHSFCSNIGAVTDFDWLIDSFNDARDSAGREEPGEAGVGDGVVFSGKRRKSMDERKVTKLQALAALLSESRTAINRQDLAQVVRLISVHCVTMFECDRCTVFTVDNFTHELVARFYVDGDDAKGEMREFRVPFGQGIVGTVASTGEILNIMDAWSDPRFSNSTDLKTGYRTRTILCAPLKTSNGKLIAVVQGINKHNDECFGQEDQDMMALISNLLSDLIQRMLLEKHNDIIQSSAAIGNEVKQMLEGYYANDEPSQAVCRVATIAVRLHRWQTGLQKAKLGEFKRWDFDHFHLHDDTALLAQYVTGCFEHFHVLSEYRISPDTVTKYLSVVKGRYQQVFYHNFGHAISTLHAAFLLMREFQFKELVRPEDTFAVLVAAIGHDVEHPGYNNAYQVATESALAVLYNDISVLESHHASTVSSILKKDVPEMLAGIPVDVRKRIRKITVDSILGTDMAKHNEHVKFMASSHLHLPSAAASSDFLDAETSMNTCSSILHCADIVHPALPWVNHRKISLLIASEFFNQFQEEERQGLPTLPFMGKNPTDLHELANVQVGFIQFVVAPLFSALSDMEGTGKLVFCKNNIATNQGTWSVIGGGAPVPDDAPFEHPHRGAVDSDDDDVGNEE